MLILRGRELPAERGRWPGERAAILVHEPVREPRQPRELVDHLRGLRLRVGQLRAEPRLRTARQQRMQERGLRREIARHQRRAQFGKLRAFHRLEFLRARPLPLHHRRVPAKAQPQIAHVRRPRHRGRLEMREQPFPPVHRAPAPPFPEALRERPRLAEQQHELRHRDPLLAQKEHEMQPEILRVFRHARPQLQPLPLLAAEGKTQHRQIAPLQAAIHFRQGEKSFEPRDERGLGRQQFAPERRRQPRRQRTPSAGFHLRFCRRLHRGRHGLALLREQRAQKRAGVFAIVLHRATAMAVPRALRRIENHLSEIRFRPAHLGLPARLARNLAHPPHHAAGEIILPAFLRRRRQPAQIFPGSIFEGG